MQRLLTDLTIFRQQTVHLDDIRDGIENFVKRSLVEWSANHRAQRPLLQFTCKRPLILHAKKVGKGLERPIMLWTRMPFE